MSLIERATSIAVRAHRGQVDKSGVPYILHPMRVGASLVSYGEYAVAAGLLHDVLEDSDFTPWDLAGLAVPDEVIDAVKAVSKGTSERTPEAYRESVARAMEHPLGRFVKAADMLDNFARLDSVPDDATRLRLFRKYVAVEPLVVAAVPGFGLMRPMPRGEVLYWG